MLSWDGRSVDDDIGELRQDLIDQFAAINPIATVGFMVAAASRLVIDFADQLSQTEQDDYNNFLQEHWAWLATIPRPPRPDDYLHPDDRDQTAYTLAVETVLESITDGIASVPDGETAIDAAFVTQLLEYVGDPAQVTRWREDLLGHLVETFPRHLGFHNVQLLPTDVGQDLKPRAILADPQLAGSYYVFAAGVLWRLQETELTMVAPLPTITMISRGLGDGRSEGKPLEIALYADGPWVGVTERFGVNAALVDTRSGEVRPFVRTDYHCDVSSYSFGFLHHTGRTVVAAQTQWNRLDLFDAETGELLTDREVSITESGEVGADGNRIYRKVNYLDYFHSLLHTNPSGTAFLSNGWVWHPADMVRIYRVEQFFNTFDPGGVSVDAAFGYNWDRPAAFISDDTFVLAVDDKTIDLDEEDLADYRYHQLAFFTVPEFPTSEHWRPPIREIDCDFFPRNEYGEVKGEMHFDPTSGLLVALTTTAGAALITLDGEVVHREPELSAGPAPTNWTYSAEHRRFYRWHDGSVEERPFPQTSPAH
jgi:hypothetical protein